MIDQTHIPIGDVSATAEARREATNLARTIGFDESAIGRLAIVVTEAATNLIKHAVEGQLLLRAFERDGVAVMEAMALDQGPGMANVAACMRDGYSTAGSQGGGLGAMIRLADEFDIYSIPGKGTSLVARISARKPSAAIRPRPLDMGVVCLPKPGETVCGDSWGERWQDGRCIVLVADGLGHGPNAATASMEAVEALRTHSDLSPAALIEHAHGALRSTRGAAVAVAELDLARHVRYAGVGNISGVVLTPEGARHMVSHNGIIGHEMRKVQEFVYEWSEDTIIVLHSDGLTTHWNLEKYPGLVNRSSSLIAGVLYRDFTRGRDDVTVVVIKKL